jgi:hypothetical protein
MTLGGCALVVWRLPRQSGFFVKGPTLIVFVHCRNTVDSYRSLRRVWHRVNYEIRTNVLSLISQSNHGIDARRAAGGNITGRQGDDREHDWHYCECKRIDGRCLKQQFGNETD